MKVLDIVAQSSCTVYRYSVNPDICGGGVTPAGVYIILKLSRFVCTCSTVSYG